MMRTLKVKKEEETEEGDLKEDEAKKRRENVRQRRGWEEEEGGVERDMGSKWQFTVLVFLVSELLPKGIKVSSEIMWNLDICPAPCKLFYSSPETSCSSPFFVVLV